MRRHVSALELLSGYFLVLNLAHESRPLKGRFSRAAYRQHRLRCVMPLTVNGTQLPLTSAN